MRSPGLRQGAPQKDRASKGLDPGSRPQKNLARPALFESNFIVREVLAGEVLFAIARRGTFFIDGQVWLRPKSFV